MDLYRTWVEAPWREMPGWVKVLTLVLAIVAGNVVDHVISGWAGILLALVLVLVVVIVVPLGWRTLRS
jgi:hypothetical protein